MTYKASDDLALIMAVREASRAMTCLYLEAPEVVVNDMRAKVDEAFKAYQLALAACERAVRKDYEWILKELVGWGMQTELSDLDLTTAEFSEIWREAQKLLKQAKAVQP